MKSLSPLLFYADVPAKYNFDTETEIDNAKIYLYELFKEKLADGLLISKTMLGVKARIEENKKKSTIVPRSRTTNKTYQNIRNYLHLKKKKIPQKYITFADPGTWSYVNHKKLPEFLFGTEDVFHYYNSLHYDLCGSVDHPTVDKIRYKNDEGKIVLEDLSQEQKDYRINLTIELAKEFMGVCNKHKSIINFMPFGTVQGYDEKSYLMSLKKILKFGYKYVAIGGLPGYHEKKVLELLIPIRKIIRKYKQHKYIGIHLYGRFPSPDSVYPFARAGVTTFDNNSSYISASRTNCTVFDPTILEDLLIQTPNPVCYNIRIPSVRSRVFYKFRRLGIEEENQYKKIESVCYNRFVLCNHKSSEMRIKKFLKSYERLWSLMKIVDAKLTDKKISNVVEKADRSLRSRLWKRCSCTACKQAGVHILLMRGHPRIPYTFAHNTYLQYKRLQIELQNLEIQKLLKCYDWSELNDIRRNNYKSSLTTDLE